MAAASAGADAAGCCEARFAGAFVAGAFFAPGFFFAGAGAAAVALLPAEAAFFAAGWFFAFTGAAATAAAFLAEGAATLTADLMAAFVTLLGLATFVADLFAAGDLDAAGAAATGALPTRNASRFFAAAIQPGARPTPVQVFPVFGSAYLGSEAVLAFAFAFAFVFFAAGFLVTVWVRCSIVRLNSDMMSLTFAIAEAISVFAIRSAWASSAAICLFSAVSLDIGFEGEKKLRV